jgi:hypothetical protein
MAYKVFQNGIGLPASELNTYLMNQTVMVFADSTARSTALTAPTAGMVTYLTTPGSFEYHNGTGWTTLISIPTGQALNRPILTSPQEVSTVSATAATGTIQYDVMTQADLYYTSNATANFTINFRGNSSVALNSIMAIGTSQTVVFRNTNGATAYYPTAITIDGTAVTPKWQGGTAPTAGNASSIDVYAYVITKTAANTYTVMASQTKFA